MSVSAPHPYYICPEGAKAKLVCEQQGTTLHKNDKVKQMWGFTPHSDQHCPNNVGPRQIPLSHLHGNHSFTPGLEFGHSEHQFWVILENLTIADQGRYCCRVLDIQTEHGHKSLAQRLQSFVILKVSPGKNTICIKMNVQ